jgi:hypothetical protein
MTAADLENPRGVVSIWTGQCSNPLSDCEHTIRVRGPSYEGEGDELDARCPECGRISTLREREPIYENVMTDGGRNVDNILAPGTSTEPLEQVSRVPANLPHPKQKVVHKHQYDDSDGLACNCETPTLALDESEIGPTTVQVLWCSVCESVLKLVHQEGKDA